MACEECGRDVCSMKLDCVEVQLEKAEAERDDAQAAALGWAQVAQGAREDCDEAMTAARHFYECWRTNQIWTEDVGDESEAAYPWLDPNNL
jgi:hypothetical protein